jgi:biopolymer transport protein TolR
MARTFRRARQMHPIADLNITNLVDLGFTLLIIFMIATPLINQEQTLPVNLPVESVSAQSKPDPNDKTETITIKADGTVVLGSRPLTLSQLARELVPLAAQARQPVIHLRLDAKATAQQFVAVMDELKKNRLSKISFDTQTAR